MKACVLRMGLGLLLAGGVSGAVSAEPESKALPTLLIKGEVVSLDANDPSAMLLKVKDRYGFETPIFVGQETKIAQGETILQPTSLATGASVEVEYNFDVNTAKRHAVSVKVSAPPPAPAAAEAPAATEGAAPEAAAPAESAAPAAPAEAPASADTPAGEGAPATP